MAKNNYLNPEILPPRKGTDTKDHHKLINGALLAAAAAVIIGFAYWWTIQKEIINDVQVPGSFIDEAIIELNKPPQSQAPPEDIDSIINSKNKITTPSKEEKAEIIERLNKITP